MEKTMSTNTLPFTVSAGSGRLHGFAAAVSRRLVAMGRAWRHRQDLALLSSFDDRMLADIGLTRGDVRDAAAQSPWRDPTAVLVNRATERRRARIRFVPDRNLEPLPAPPTVPEIDAWSTRQFPARSRYY
jgi:uncharacterized protein YjiS (DUF1127 family)